MATASFSTMEFDPATGQINNKKPKQNPYLDPNGSSQGYLPYTGNQPQEQPKLPVYPMSSTQLKPDQQSQQATPNSLEQGNANVMGAAQNAAMNQANPQNNAIRNQTQQMTQNVMNNPSGGMDWAKYNAGQLSQYDANAALTTQKAKRELGGMGGAGQVQAGLINMMLQQNTDRSKLDNTLQMQQHDKSLEDQYKAINQGIDTADSFDKSQSVAIDNLLKVRAGYEGERSQDSANTQELTVLDKTFGQDMAKMLTQNDWQGAQNQLDREWKSAEALNDRNAQNTIVDKQIALDKWKQENGQVFTAEQNALNRALELTKTDKDAALQTSLLTLKGQIDKGLLVDQQSFTAVQNELNRKAEAEANAGNWQNALEITKLKGEIDAAAQKNQQAFAKTEREATQAWQTGERIDTNKAAEYMKILDQKHELAMQSNDIQAKKEIEDSQAKLQLQLQTQEMAQETKMAYLKDQLDTARADGDVGRQKQILDFQHTQEMEKIEKEQGHDEAMAYLKNNLDIALQNNDAVNADLLQTKRLEAEATQRDKDRQVEQAKVDLEKQGVDMQKLDQEYEKLQSLVDAGSLDPSVLTQFVQKTLSTAGVKLTPPDPNAAKKEAQAKMDELKAQFVSTHPEYAYTGSVFDSNGKLLTGTIKPEGLKAFNEFYNSSVYGELTAAEKEAKKNAGKLGAEDLQYGDVGDVFKLDKETTFNGQKIPAGEYRVINADYSKGSKFWGTKENYTKRVLVDVNGNPVATIKDSKSGNEGNIVSNLWAGDA